MAIFGDLITMSTPDVLKMLGSRTGKLHIHSPAQKQYELHLHKGALFCFRENGVSVTVKAALQRSLIELFGLRQGEFDFDPTSKVVLDHEVHLTRQEVWQLLARTNVEGDASDANPTTDKTTRFKFRDSAPQTTELPSNLQSFLQRSQASLAIGCSASELTEVVNLPVPLVQLYLIRLRSLDIVTPVRAYAANYVGYDSGYKDDDSGDESERAGDRVGLLEPVYLPKPIATTPTQNPAQTSVIPSETWSSQEPTGSQLSSAPQTSIPESRVQQPLAPEPHVPDVQPPTPKRNLVRRLLSALFSGGKR